MTLACYGALEIVGVIIIVIISKKNLYRQDMADIMLKVTERQREDHVNHHSAM